MDQYGKDSSEKKSFDRDMAQGPLYERSKDISGEYHDIPEAKKPSSDLPLNTKENEYSKGSGWHQKHEAKTPAHGKLADDPVLQGKTEQTPHGKLYPLSGADAKEAAGNKIQSQEKAAALEQDLQSKRGEKEDRSEWIQYEKPDPIANTVSNEYQDSVEGFDKQPNYMKPVDEKPRMPAERTPQQASFIKKAA